MKKGAKLLSLLMAAVMMLSAAAFTTDSAYGASGSFKTKKTKVTLTAGERQITVKWKKVKGAKGYQIYRASSKKGKYKRIKTIKKSSTVKYVNKKLKADKTYYYKVRAYKTSKGKKVYSKYSAVKSKKALSKKAVAKKYIGKSVDKLIAAIGKPKSTDYAQSCFGPGEDGELRYSGFKVYTYREDGKETVMSVE
ncbi:fibronectin type III domain-containing protein [bacterium 210820-DFI.6.37]|nr:fibronectin type III domain-containing protein [bacterium 210820-DFI.6.37]